MSRIVAGSAGGRPLVVPPGHRVRPTGARAREGLFSTLTTLTELSGARVVDLYAGSGALGLEALSRGASVALFAESDPGALRILRRNVDALGLSGASIAAGPVERMLAVRPEGAAYDVVLADPPYALSDDEVTRVVARLVAQRWLAREAVVVVERPTRGAPVHWPRGLVEVKARRYGEGTLWYGRAAPTAPVPEGDAA